MKPFYKDGHNTVCCLDFRKNDLPDESVQCVVTSPPYWGLRKYSGQQELIWGGDKDCEHQWYITPPRRSRKASDIVNLNSKEATVGGNLGLELPSTNTCSLCGAWKGAYGLEPTPEMYIEHTIEILREIRRVLRKDGVVFWNIGDSYAGSGCGTNDYRTEASRSINKSDVMFTKAPPQQKAKAIGLKPKDLCLIPFRLAIAAQEDGWWVRSVIIWSKPNPMPESVKDRPTESHEYILLLTKSARYYWDADAVREISTERSSGNKERFIAEKGERSRLNTHLGSSVPYKPNGTGRNIRSVWEFPTQPYPEAHFAVFPEKLPETCIKAATPEVGCCSKCGAPWERILDKKPSAFNIRVRDAMKGRGTAEEGYKATDEEIENYRQYGNHPPEGYQRTIGWQPTCKCNADKVPSLVLDPFMGAGTTLYVAKKLNRYAVGYEISEDYCRLAMDRCRQQALI